MCEMYVSACVECGVLFGITKNHEAQLRKSGNDFYCPNGHILFFSESCESKIKDLRKRLRHQALRCSALEDERIRAEKRAKAYQMNMGKLKKRLGEM